MMKAYEATSDYAEGSVVVFAENRGKAKATALHSDTLEDLQFIDVRVRRLPLLDKLYKSDKIADWCDDNVRLILVRDYHWSCIEPDYDNCKVCPAEKYCYGSVLEEIEE